jgi:A118 family predicted phage portal protein
MAIFERLKRKMQETFLRAGANTGMAKEYKSIFDLQDVPAFNQFYNIGIFPWKYLYRGFYKPWHLIPAPTIADPQHKREMSYLNMSNAISAEIAGMVWTDQCDVCVSIEGNDSEYDPLHDYIQHVLKHNNFQKKMGEAIEQAAALGGEALKTWYEVKRDSEGNEIPETGEVKIGYAMADQFVPTAWSNAGVSDGIFVSRQARGGYYYTLLEWHIWDGTTYIIRNELYRAEQKKAGVGGDQDILGFRYPLAELYPYLDDEVVIDTEKSLFTYFRTPRANNIDDNSPLGVSMYANAMDTLHAIDICFDSFVREFRLGKKRIIVPARMIRNVVDPVTGKNVRYFDATDETYEALSTDDPDTLKIQDNSVVLRVTEHVDAMNALLNILCLQVGLSFGTFSFDMHGGIKTATEVVSENSKTYKTIKNFQNQITPAIEELIDAIIQVASLYEVVWDGYSIRELAARGYTTKVTLDDGIVQDRQTNINEGMTLVGAGLMSKFKFLTDPKYGQNLTEEDALAELKRISEESAVTLPQLDLLDLNTTE